MRVLSSFEYFGSCFCEDGDPQDVVKIGVDERLKIFGAMKKM